MIETFNPREEELLGQLRASGVLLFQASILLASSRMDWYQSLLLSLLTGSRAPALFPVLRTCILSKSSVVTLRLQNYYSNINWRLVSQLHWLWVNLAIVLCRLNLHFVTNSSAKSEEMLKIKIISLMKAPYSVTLSSSFELCLLYMKAPNVNLKTWRLVLWILKDNLVSLCVIIMTQITTDKHYLYIQTPET